MKLHFLAMACSPVLMATSNVSAAPAIPNDLSVVLLGTAGGPEANARRAQPASLLKYGDDLYLIDAGDGVANQIAKAGVDGLKLKAILLTHLHADHMAGIGTLALFAWMNGGAKQEPYALIGPPGTREVAINAAKAFSVSERLFKSQLPGWPTIASRLHATEVNSIGPQVVYRDENIVVTAVENTHFSTLRQTGVGHRISRSFSYRFDSAAGSVIFTGDTGPSEAVQRLAKGADLLVSEVIDVPEVIEVMSRMFGKDAPLERINEHMRREHLPAQELGKLATAAGVRSVVMTHIIGSHPEKLEAEIRRYYQGPVKAGEDLDVIRVRRDTESSAE
jgi:ribonuclease BN (tRNA processing enzyme)